MPNIQEVIIHRTNYGEQHFLILDQMPNFLFERKNNFIFAEDDGFFECYSEVIGTSGAFAGRKFDIPMKDGSVVWAKGQIWNAGHSENAPYPIKYVGISTLDRLHSCYVFQSGYVNVDKLNSHLAKNEPTYDYYKYDKRK